MRLNLPALDILRDAATGSPDRYMTADGRLFCDRAEADQHQRTVFINRYDAQQQRAQTRAATECQP